MKRKTPFARHALERVCERYGIRLTRKQQLAFGRMLSNPKHAIPLTRNRLACYFQGKWYLLACSGPLRTTSTRLMRTRTEPAHATSSRTMPSTMPPCPVTVQTFLRLEDATDDDKLILMHDERYLKTNNDAFHVLSASHNKFTEPLPPRGKITIELPDDLTDDELPGDEIQTAESMLNTCCDEKR